MSCSKTKLPRPVRGNAFNIAVKVVASRLDGTVIDDFELSPDDVLNIVYRGTLTPTAFTIEDNNVALIHFDGTQAVGMYGVDFGGVWAGESWRFALPIIFQVVDQTSQGWLPKDGIIVDPTYEVVASITIATAGSTVQADWAETDPDAPAYIKNKPTIYTKQQTDALVAQERQARQQADTTLDGKITANAYAIAAEKSRAEAAEKQNADDIDDIEAVIPSQASVQNQLADKNFVNSSIATNTANFVGTYNSLAELQTVQNPTNNDYGFVIDHDAAGNEYYDRYKYVASSQQWLFEYKVESTPFTAVQWAAIQSGITSALVTKLTALPTNAELQHLTKEATDAANAAARNANEKAALAEQEATEAGRVNATLNGTKLTVVDRNGNIVTQDVQGPKGDPGDKGDPGTTDYNELTNKPVIPVIPDNTAYLGDSDGSGSVPDNLVIVEAEDWPLTNGDKGTIYRVQGTTSYTDFAWDGMKFVPMATYNNLIDDEPTVGSDNLVKSGGVADVYGKYVNDGTYIYCVCDNSDRILFCLKADGSVEWFVGIPTPVKDYVDGMIANILIGTQGEDVDGMTKIISFLEDFSTSDTLKSLLDGKVDGEYVESNEYIYAKCDADGKVLFGIKLNGDIYFGAGVPKQIKDYIESIPALDPSEIEEEIEKNTSKISTVEEGKQLNTSTLYLNPENEILPKIENLKRSSKTKSNAVTNSDVLSLLHFSDVHGGNANILGIKAFYEHYGSYINDVIHTGDVANNYRDGLPSAFSQTPYILHVVGNHEASDRIGTPPNHHWETVSSKTVYDFMFAPNIASWGNIVQPQGAAENGCCYYYKDYPNSNIRLIVLDNIPSLGGGPSHWNATQKTWFEGVLADVLESSSSAYGYHVVVALHYPPFEINQDFDNNPFTAISHPVNSSLYANVQIPNAVKNFIDAGGTFATYLCGHVHDDMFGFGKAEGFQNQFVICTCCATPTATQSYTDMQMKSGNRTQDCFNIVGIDAYSKLVKVMRIGAQYDLHMRRHDTICVDYGQSKIIYAN
jgi:hypothetical protein